MFYLLNALLAKHDTMTCGCGDACQCGDACNCAAGQTCNSNCTCAR